MLWGRSRRSKNLAARFVAAVNARDVDAMAKLVTDDFTYIDSWRDGIRGRDQAMAAARALFAADPGFGAEVESASYSAPYVLMRGWVTSANPSVPRLRATWRARIQGDFIDEWQSWTETPAPNRVRSFVADQTQAMTGIAPERPDAL